MIPPATNYLHNILAGNDLARMALREIPQFRGASERLLDLLFQYGRVVVLEPGEDLIKQGGFDQWVYFLFSGRLSVLVDEVHVDTISSSMVGERCILGEPRGATLRAGEDGVEALGVDMAALDALRRGQGTASEAQVMVELLAGIAGEVVRRVADLVFSDVDMTAKNSGVLNLDRACGMIEALRDETFRDDSRLNMEIYKFLRKRHPAVLAGVVHGASVEVDTRALYVHFIGSGDYESLLELGTHLADYVAGLKSEDPPLGARQARAFPAFVERLRNDAADLLTQTGRERAEATDGLRDLVARVWRRRFRLDRDLRVDLIPLCAELQQHAAIEAQDLFALLEMIVKEASAETALINVGIQQMLAEMRQSSLTKHLASESSALDADALMLSGTETGALPVFSRHVLKVQLVAPYQRVLAERAGGQAPGAKGASSEAEDMIDSLFD